MVCIPNIIRFFYLLETCHSIFPVPMSASPFKAAAFFPRPQEMLRLANFQAMLGPWLGLVAYHAAQWRNRFFAYSVEEVWPEMGILYIYI